MATPAPTVVASNGTTSTPQANGSFTLAAPTPAPVDNTVVPTKAPTGQTSTSVPTPTPVSTPTPVVSSQPAVAQVAKMQTTATNSQTAIDTQTANNQTQTLAQIQAKAANQGKPGFDVLGNPIASAQQTAAQTPEDAINNTPEVGNKFVYDAQGNRSEIPIDSNPPGYTANDPTNVANKGVTGTVTTTAGTTVQQYADGTYGTLDLNGKYIGSATAQDYNNAQGLNTTMTQMTQLQNGTYPLTSAQQAQLDGLKSQFQALITTQQTANANLTGGTTIAENLYGMGTSLSGLGEIKGTVDSGLAKIADLNNQLASATAAMMQSFQDNDLKLLTASYNMYSDAVKSRQTELDNMTTALAKKTADDAAAAEQKREFNQGEQDKATALTASQNNATDSDIRTAIDDASKNGASKDTIAAMNTALANHDYAGAIQAGAGSMQDPTSTGGMYTAYVNSQKALGKAPMSAGDFIAAQKYKEAYASASASAAAQSAFTDSDSNQSKLEHELQTAALSSRSDLGIQNKKVSTSIDLRQMLNQFKQPDGTYKVPATNYTELAVGLATLLSPTGVPAQSVVQDLQQKTAKGDLAGAITYVTGVQQTGTTQDILKTLSDSIDRQGQTAEGLRNQELAAETPSDLDPERAAAVVSKLPSYDNLSQGDIQYQTPEQINNTAVAGLANVKTTNPSAYNAMIAKFPNASSIDLAKIFGLLPATQ